MRTALGIEHCINKTPAANPSKLKTHVGELGMAQSSKIKVVDYNLSNSDETVVKLLKLREHINKIQTDIKISINDILVKALALAQRKNPQSNILIFVLKNQAAYKPN